MFKAPEDVTLSWDQVQIWETPGCFVIGSKTDRKIASSLSYLDVDNVHVLENMIRAFSKNSKPNLSSLLD